ncbi:MAG: magnesium/cobalt transporter CorA [Actinomycetota bacterium]|nr:magnesium/cobalt transporter CorA [Actinomycetota bacterium]
MIVDCAVYEDGMRRAGDVPLELALEKGRRSPDAFVWIGLAHPGADEIAAVAKEFHLHPLAVEDAVKARQRPKLEVYGDTMFVVLKAARYVDSEEVVEMSQLMLFIGDGFVVTVRHGESDVLSGVRKTIEQVPDELGCGPLGVLHAVLDRVVDDYASVLRGLDDDIEEIEKQVFSDTNQNHGQRIYKLKREVLEFRQAVEPLAEPLQHLMTGRIRQAGAVPVEYFRDVHDHVLRVADRIRAVDSLLDSALDVNLAQVSVRQNEDMRKISAWVAIAGVSTLIAGVYGMNFEDMPELGWLLGYPFALTLMVASSLFLYFQFRRRGWL